jgi:hypothetical protein
MPWPRPEVVPGSILAWHPTSIQPASHWGRQVAANWLSFDGVTVCVPHPLERLPCHGSGAPAWPTYACSKRCNRPIGVPAGTEPEAIGAKTGTEGASRPFNKAGVGGRHPMVGVGPVRIVGR